MRKMILILILLVISNCESDSPVENRNEDVPENVLEVEVAKWYHDHQATVVITFDAAWGQKGEYFDSKLQEAVDEILDRNLHMDFEFVSQWFDKPGFDELLAWMRDDLIPSGIHFFGHGHKHINHDAVGFDSAYVSFKTCYDLMKSWGLNPKVYGYPESRGLEYDTQLACKLAGFIAARGATFDRDKFFICPDDKTEPENWYYLPCIPMAYEEKEIYVHNHDELEPTLASALEKNAWIIIMYHNIGLPDVGWGWYPTEEFIKDIDYIAANDFWPTNFDNVVMYVQERNNFEYQKICLEESNEKIKYEVVFNDNLDDTLYNHPLTINIKINPDLNAKKIEIEPAIDGKSDFNIYDINEISLDLIPDGTRYLFSIFL